MTKNQIALRKQLEDERANREREFEARRSNMADEGIKRDQNTETGRHNLVTESQSHLDLRERARSNRANEGLKRQDIGVNLARLQETNRANLVNEQLNRDKLSQDRSLKQSELDINQQRVDNTKAIEEQKLAQAERFKIADLGMQTARTAVDIVDAFIPF